MCNSRRESIKQEEKGGPALPCPPLHCLSAWRSAPSPLVISRGFVVVSLALPAPPPGERVL